MSEEHWHRARLIPTSGISGQVEAERRATSALLAVASAVKEFGSAIVRPLGAPAGQLETFIEVPFKLGERTVIPDGLLRTSRGSRQWTALLEVKTADGCLQKDQVEDYLDVAKEQGFDVVLTISNQMESAPGVHPVDVDRRKLKKVALYHLSWAEVLTIAVQQRVHRGVSDPDQAWILGELIRYLEHPKSGALDFDDMGPSWVAVREAVLAGTLRQTDQGLSQVVSRWEQLLRFAALRLGRELGTVVEVALNRKEQADPLLRAQQQAASLVATGQLTGSLRIPGAISPLAIVADLRAGTVTVSVDIDAPREGRSTTRVNWLSRQLKDAPESLRIEAWTMNARSSTSELLRTVREQPAMLIVDPAKELRTFRVSALSSSGMKRGTGKGSFIDSILAAIDGFYASVMQQLRPWSARAPQLPQGQSAVEAAGLDLSAPPTDLTVSPEGAQHVETSTNLLMVEHDHSSRHDSVYSENMGELGETTGLESRPAGLDDLALVRSQPPAVDPELTNWDAALDRLARERDSDLHLGLPSDRD